MDICKKSGKIANKYCPAKEVEHRVFVTGAAEGSGEGEYNINADALSQTCDIHTKENTQKKDKKPKPGNEDPQPSGDDNLPEEPVDPAIPEEPTDPDDTNPEG